jgi:competence protein ComEA
VKPTSETVSLLLLLTVVMLTTYISRESRVAGDPAFIMHSGTVLVQLGSGFRNPESISQINDGDDFLSVIKMAGLPVADVCVAQAHTTRPLKSGERLDLQVQDGVVQGFFIGWMPAAQRVALGIALHPDQMNREDWQSLSGIGPRLAQRIAEDRQKNGDFGSLEGVQRVQGIGNKRVLAWSQLFISPVTTEKID